MSNTVDVESSSSVEEKASQLYFNFGLCMLPHQDKKHKGGEDASVANGELLCVCDGVGGWASQGIDPADFSRALAGNVGRIFAEQMKNPKLDQMINVIHKPGELLDQAVSSSSPVGSSTCVIAMLDADKMKVHTANLGDSSYMWLRKSGVDLDCLYRAKEQTMGFNFPKQVGTNGNHASEADL